MIWMFVAFMMFADGHVEEWPAEFSGPDSQVECEAFRGHLSDWLDVHAEEFGIVGASWDPACYEAV